MKFTIVAFPSRFIEDEMNYLLVRVVDGACVGMIDACVVADVKQMLGMKTTEEVEKENLIELAQIKIPFERG